MWSEQYKLGIDEIDKQHKILIGIFERLIDCTNIEMDDCFRELLAYSKYHFETEEKYFNVLSEKNKREHKILHKFFIRSIEDYTQAVNILNRKKLVYFLSAWIKNHILIEDRKLIEKQ